MANRGTLVCPHSHLPKTRRIEDGCIYAGEIAQGHRCIEATYRPVQISGTSSVHDYAAHCIH